VAVSQQLALEMQNENAVWYCVPPKLQAMLRQLKKREVYHPTLNRKDLPLGKTTVNGF